ncbi:LolA family protein [Natrarchaeobaculum aegyptiacum]|uniref:DUF2092 domain-containing protein n=1 Tax=Natrarchaeobaculum aegyptiacum TaxID=745377 RepID=A0A2Z2I2Q1_9EURY|nr:DUF2092 domain-containing protein [Natrarchaeobaculum aegyptiacum]ARS91268.1 DUF2092 domain-containing protein [Natrarchaeobaculum aegyptiacum]
MDRQRIALGLVVLAATVTLAGCSAISIPGADGTSGEPDPVDVFEGAFVHSDDLEAVSGERTMLVSDGEATTSETVAVAERPYVEYRSEVLESAVPDREGDVYVSNATGSWWYYPDSNVVHEYRADEPYDSDEVRAARADEADRQADLYDVEYLGTETVADREAHVVDVTAANETVTEGLSLLVGDTEFVFALETVNPEAELEVVEQRLWIDVEYDYPLREEVVIEDDDGTEYLLREWFESVDFEDDVDDETFVFEPPANATVHE